MTHPIGSGLFITFAYTYSHDLQNFTAAGVASGFNVVDIYNPRGSYGNAEGLDYRHSGSLSAIYTLPIFKQAVGVKHALLGGWKLSDVTTIRSGTAITPALSVSGQANSVRPNRLVGVSLKGPKQVGQWFNTAAFVAPNPRLLRQCRDGSCNWTRPRVIRYGFLQRIPLDGVALSGISHRGLQRPKPYQLHNRERDAGQRELWPCDGFG